MTCMKLSLHNLENHQESIMANTVNLHRVLRDDSGGDVLTWMARVFDKTDRGLCE